MPNTKKSRCKIQRDFFVQGSERGEQSNRTDSYIKIAEPPPVRCKNNRAGEVMEPVRDTKNPQSKLNNNIPFTKRPKALEFDYKVEPGGKQIKATGFSRIVDIPEQNNAEASLLLQYRWEDEKGNLFAKRVGTAYERYDQEVKEWQNGHRIKIHYGDITGKDFYQPYMDLVKGESTQYAANSQGKIVPIQEIGWASPDTTPTHIILRFSSGHGGAYIGAPDAKFWIDNVKLVY